MRSFVSKHLHAQLVLGCNPAAHGFAKGSRMLVQVGYRTPPEGPMIIHQSLISGTTFERSVSGRPRSLAYSSSGLP